MEENTRFWTAMALAQEDGFDPARKGTIDVCQAAANYEPGDRMTKDVYPALAKAGRWTTVERRMRTAVRDAWKRRGLDDCPTVGQYVASLALRVRYA